MDVLQEDTLNWDTVDILIISLSYTVLTIMVEIFAVT